jgi:hypothetical protein
VDGPSDRPPVALEGSKVCFWAGTSQRFSSTQLWLMARSVSGPDGVARRRKISPTGTHNR